MCGVDERTYSNRCEAECQGVEVECEGECICTGQQQFPVVQRSSDYLLLHKCQILMISDSYSKYKMNPQLCSLLKLYTILTLTIHM